VTLKYKYINAKTPILLIKSNNNRKKYITFA